MKVERQVVKVRGYDLNRLVLRPDGEVRAAFVFLHGQGDYVDRYDEVLKPLAEAGVVCVLTDLPGHGRSPGKRGRIPGYDFVEAVYENACEVAAAESDVIGLGGHSLGGHLALWLLLKNAGRHDFSWVSSPLIESPMKGMKKKLLTFAGSLFPWVSWSTGVTSAACRPDDGSAGDDEEREKLYHSRITLGWGRDLTRMLPLVKDQLLVSDLKTRLFFTQGGEDPVCPPEILVDLVGRMKTPAEIEVIPEGLHEPFVGNGSLVEGVVRRIFAS